MKTPPKAALKGKKIPRNESKEENPTPLVTIRGGKNIWGMCTYGALLLHLNRPDLFIIFLLFDHKHFRRGIFLIEFNLQLCQQVSL